jgi:glycosyltransferase involved in cell wall biosynthesis
MVPRHDEDSGSVRMTALLRILVELGHPVTFLPDDLAHVEPYTTDVQQLGVEVVYGQGAVRFVEAYRSQFDIVILSRVHFAAKHIRPLLAMTDRPSIIFDTVDLHYLREQRQAAIENDPELAESANRTRDVELDVMRSSDRVWVTSTSEAVLLRSTDPSLPPVDVVPTIHTVRTQVPPFAARKDILFIGGFRHAPNEDAVLYFVNDIFPRVRADLPDMKLLIVGSHIPESILSLASEDITVLGHVPEVSPLFDACRLSVAPLRFGAGVKGKVTQSLALGLPTVATPIAAEGLDLVDGEHLAIAADPIAFARCVVDVYRNETLWNRLSESGRRHIEARLGHEAVKKSVAAILAEL